MGIIGGMVMYGSGVYGSSVSNLPPYENLNAQQTYTPILIKYTTVSHTRA